MQNYSKYYSVNFIFYIGIYAPYKNNNDGSTCYFCKDNSVINAVVLVENDNKKGSQP